MGDHANGPVRTAVGVVFLVVIAVAAIGAVPLMYASRMGQA